MMTQFNDVYMHGQIPMSVKLRNEKKKKRMKCYRQVSNIRRTLVGNKIVDYSDVVGALHVGAAPTTSSFST